EPGVVDVTEVGPHLRELGEDQREGGKRPQLHARRVLGGQVELVERVGLPGAHAERVEHHVARVPAHFNGSGLLANGIEIDGHPFSNEQVIRNQAKRNPCRPLAARRRRPATRLARGAIASTIAPFPTGGRHRRMNGRIDDPGHDDVRDTRDRQMNKDKTRSRGLGHIGRFILVGFFTVAPLWVTWLVFDFVIGVLARTGRPLLYAAARGVSNFSPTLASWMLESAFEQAVALIIVLAALYAVGVFATILIGRKLIAWFESLMVRLPLVQTIY